MMSCRQTHWPHCGNPRRGRGPCGAGCRGGLRGPPQQPRGHGRGGAAVIVASREPDTSAVCLLKALGMQPEVLPANIAMCKSMCMTCMDLKP